MLYMYVVLFVWMKIKFYSEVQCSSKFCIHKYSLAQHLGLQDLLLGFTVGIYCWDLLLNKSELPCRQEKWSLKLKVKKCFNED